MTNPLSPAAQAVLEVVTAAPHCGSGRIKAAAALQAVADQVVPEDCLEHFPNDSAWQGGFTDANERIRTQLLAIAAELEAHS